MVTALVSTPIHLNALQIPRLTHGEAQQLATTELERVLTVVEALSGPDWEQATDCTAWNVRDMVAHLAGACAGSASLAEFTRQMIRNPYIRTASAPVDGINRRQLEDRAHQSTTELIEELRRVGPQAIRNRQRTPWLVRKMRLPMGAPLGIAPLEYLFDNIYTRDQWMHRADLCRATGQKMHLTPEHDGRIVALILRDLAYLQRASFHSTVDLYLVGDISLDYRFGNNALAEASITMDIIEFNRLASDRLAPAEAFELATIDGDITIARNFLANSSVPF